MLNTNSKNIENCDYCNSCNDCNDCKNCYSCDYCDFSYGLRMSEKMIFCLGEGKYESKGAGYQKNLQIFNQQVTEEVYNKTKSVLGAKNFKLPIAKWIEEEDMTDDEKSDWKSYKETGGYLKNLIYKDAWKEMWTGLSLEDRKFFSTLPNWNKNLFLSITGIDYNLDSEISDNK